nr:hypothetical protein [Tanacetum cinerariifolium]
PAHHGGVGIDAALQYFVPADELFALCGQEFLDAAIEPTLHLLHVGEAFALHNLLHGGAFLPAGFGGFVAPDVHVLARKQRDHLGQHVFKKAEGGFGGAHDVLVHAPHRPGCVGAGPASQLGVGGQHGYRVARHFDFGHDEEVPAHVEVQAAPGKGRLVGDAHVGQARVGTELWRQQLQQRLAGVEEPRPAGRRELHACLVDYQPVALGTRHRAGRE